MPVELWSHLGAFLGLTDKYWVVYPLCLRFNLILPTGFVREASPIAKRADEGGIGDTCKNSVPQTEAFTSFATGALIPLMGVEPIKSGL